MRNVGIEYHVVARADVEPAPILDDLQIAFRTMGIDLEFKQGETIPSDPADSRLNSYADLVLRFSKQSQTAGHFIFGLVPIAQRFEVAGQLLDFETRGVAVAYTRSLFVMREGVAGLAKTCAHEIGHLLNLAHSDVTSIFCSGMDEIDTRNQDVAAAWEAARVEATTIAGSGSPAYFEPPVRVPRCHPFAFVAREALNKYDNASLLPWGSPFTRPFTGLNDAPSGAARGMDSVPRLSCSAAQQPSRQ